jgi:RNA polymerase sigma factor (sigma-70 family)
MIVMERPVETRAAVDGARLADEVAARWAAGDREALRAAFDAWGAPIHTYCARRLPPDDVADATQEVFVSAWRAREQFDPARGSLPQWLFGIARNTCHGFHRKRGSRIAAGSDDGLEAVPAPAVVDTLPDRLLLAGALQRLPERQRAVLVASFVEDRTNHEVAERLSLPLGTVKSDIRRGLRALRSELGAVR